MPSKASIATRRAHRRNVLNLIFSSGAYSGKAVQALSELDDKLSQMSLLMETEGAGCTYEDAVDLAKFEGHVTNTNAFKSFVQNAMA